MSPTERAAFDEERRELKECYDAIMETMDPLQRGIINQRMMDFLPSEQLAFMKQLVEGDVDEIIPPSQEDVKGWKTIFLCYFNSAKSLQEGRRLPINLCVKNPRPDEICDALKSFGFRSIFHSVSSIPSNNLSPCIAQISPS